MASESFARETLQIKTIKFDQEIIIGENKKLRSCEIGQDTKSTKEKVFMVVGESGVGKTTMINFMVNYILGVNFEDNFRYQLELDNEEKTLHKRQSESQTRWITSYKINNPKRGAVGFRITIIDSPGFGDTGGEAKDKFTNDQIRAYFTDKTGYGIDHIDSVAFVIKATTTRLNKSQKFVFDSVLKIFGKDISQNIFLFLTHASSQKNPDVLAAVTDAEIPFAHYYKFDNQLLYQSKSESEDLDDQEEFIAFQKMHWRMGIKSLEKCFQDLKRLIPKSLTLSANVLMERQSLEISMDAIPELIKDSIITIEALKTEQEILNKYETEMDKHKNFTYEKVINETHEECLPDGEFAMVCTVCKFTCHDSCTHILTQYVTTCPSMYWISVIRGCSGCPGRCTPSSHAQKTFKYVKRPKTVTETKNDVKIMYDEAKKSLKEAGTKTQLRHKEMVLANEKVLEYVDEARKCLERLNEIALRPDPQPIDDYLEKLKIEERKLGEDGWEGREKVLENLIKRERERVVERQSFEKKQALSEHFTSFSV